MIQYIENGTRNLCGNGKSLTLSFWARSSITDKTLGIYLSQEYGSGGSPSSDEFLTGTQLTLTSSWTKYEYTFTTNTLSGKTFGTNYDDAVGVFFQHMAGSTYSAYSGGSAYDFGGSGNIDIAQVQLCAGSEVLPFEPKSFGDELQACQRYYEKSYDYDVVPGTAPAFQGIYCNERSAYTGTWYVPISFKVEKRDAPTVVIYNPQTGTTGEVYNVSDGTNHAETHTYETTSGVGQVSWTAVDIKLYRFHFTAQAEL
jgi:hypothetical protein